MKKIRVFEAFAGYGSQYMALKRLQEKYPDKVEFESVGMSEIEKHAITAYKAVHGDVHNFGDIMKIDWKDVPDFDLFTYSFPCFVAGTKVLVKNSLDSQRWRYINIENIKEGMLVWTHMCRWRTVYKTMSRIYDRQTYIIHQDRPGAQPIITTDEHPFYVITVKNKQKTPVCHRPKWVMAKDLNPDIHYLLIGNDTHNKDSYIQYNRDLYYDIDAKQSESDSYEFNIGIRHYKAVRISKIERGEENVRVYNISVNEDESYTANDVLVHNCTDISNAGRQSGLSEGSGTRSSLLWECKRAIEAKKPKYLLMENVKALTSKKFINDFDAWRGYLVRLGYTNYWDILNAKHFEVPQNRERVFMISILNDTQGYTFPEPILPLKKRFKDVLESEVSEKYYLTQEQVDRIIDNVEKATPQPQDAVRSTSTNLLSGIENKKKEINTDNIIQVGNLIGDREGKFSNPERGRVYSIEGIAPCQHTCPGGGHETKVIIPINTDNEGNCTTITAHYHKAGGSDFRPREQNNPVPHVGIMEVITSEPIGISSHPLSHALEFKGMQDVKTEVSPCLRATDYKAVPCVWEKPKPSDRDNRCVFRDVEDFEGPSILTPIRTEEGRRLRAEGIDEFANRKLRPRPDGTSNTLTTVEHDNLLCEPLDSSNDISFIRQACGFGHCKEQDIPGALTSNCWQENNFVKMTDTLSEQYPKQPYKRYRIRKLTEREAFRLMDVSDSDIDKIQTSGVCKTAQYKLAGNSIVVNVLYHIFRKLFVDTGGKHKPLF